MYSIIAALWWWCFVCVCGGEGGTTIVVIRGVVLRKHLVWSSDSCGLLVSTVISGTVFSSFWIELYDFSLPGY